MRHKHVGKWVLGLASFAGFGLLLSHGQTAAPVVIPAPSPEIKLPPLPAPAAIDIPPIALDPLPVIDPLPAPKPLPVVVTPSVEPLPPLPIEPAPAKLIAVEKPIAPPTPTTFTVTPRATPEPVAAQSRVAPSVSVEAVGPTNVSHGQPVVYEIIVKNVGSVAVEQVRVDEELPPGAKVISVEPSADGTGDKLRWSVGALQVGEEKRIKLQVKPGEGDLITKPTVSYAAHTTMKVAVSRPQLNVQVTGPETILINEETAFQINVTNQGSGEAAKVLLRASFTSGLRHAEGDKLDATLIKLAPGETRTVTLDRVKAVQAGSQSCLLTAVAEGATQTTAKTSVEVHQPKLELTMKGPPKVMVRGEPIYQLELGNIGTTPSQPIDLAAAFPEGLDVVAVSDNGNFDKERRTVYWKLDTQAPGARKTLSVKVRSTMPGNNAIRAVATAGKMKVDSELIVKAEGVPALSFEVADIEDPLEVGKDATYEIRVQNTGTCPCTNIRITAVASDGLSIGAIQAPVPYKTVGQSLQFEPVARLGMKADVKILVKAKGMTAGDLRLKVQLACDQLKQPVVKEESTSFFQP